MDDDGMKESSTSQAMKIAERFSYNSKVTTPLTTPLGGVITQIYRDLCKNEEKPNVRKTQ